MDRGIAEMALLSNVAHPVHEVSSIGEVGSSWTKGGRRNKVDLSFFRYDPGEADGFVRVRDCSVADWFVFEVPFDVAAAEGGTSFMSCED